MQEEKKQVFQDKYDRQIRLWGANGQKCLKDSNILLLNCEPSGVETFKNLVLPGIGRVSIVDNQKVTQQDLDKNFFTIQNDINKNRAQAVFENLLEMNPDVQGQYFDKDPSSVVQDQDFLKQYNLVVASELDDRCLKVLSQSCTNLNIILIIINTYGFVGRIRLQNGVHEIVESKPLQAQYYDMRLNKPFPALQQLADSFDIQAINDQIQQGVQDGQSGKAMDQLMHIPYAIIVIKALQEYRKLHDGKDPQSYAEKKDFKESIIKKMGSKLESPGNFEQALSFAFQGFVKPNQLHTYVQGGVKKIFDHPQLNSSNKPFWVLSRALKTYYEKQGVLPVSFNLPDMESSTENYLNLKNVFKTKFEEDLALFKEYLGETEQISDFDIRLFLQNVCYISVFDYKPYHLELEKPEVLEIDVNYNEMGEPIINNSYQWIVGIRALNLWIEQHNGEYPQYQKDEDQLYALIEQVRQTHFNVQGENSDAPIDKAIAEELCRVAQVKMHNIAAIMGGIASQEAVKLITHQFQPMNNTFLYDGNISISQTLSL